MKTILHQWLTKPMMQVERLGSSRSASAENRPRLKSTMFIALSVIAILGGMVQAQAATFTVTNTNASGAGSFAQAVSDANVSAGADVIDFDISGMGPHFISLASGVTITEAVTIDGSTQAGYAGTPVIEISGPGSGTGIICSAAATILDLSITNWNIGIRLNANNCVLRRNWIGVDAAGAAFSNTTGISINSSSDTIGHAGEPNIISGNETAIELVSGSDHRIVGNYIGLDEAGTAAIPNTVANMVFTAASGTLVHSNAISGSDGESVVFGTNTVSEVVFIRNRFGTNAAGTATIPNALSNIYIYASCTDCLIGGASADQGNQFANANGNGSPSVEVYANDGDLTIQNNEFGFNVDASGALSSDYTALMLVDVPSAFVLNNTISNHGQGMYLENVASFEIDGNNIGVTPSGTGTHGNVSHGIYVTGNSVGTIGTTNNSSTENIVANTEDGPGIQIDGSAKVVIGRNRVFDNLRLGITLNNSTTPLANDASDADTGPNDKQNYPVLTSITLVDATYTITGTLHSKPNRTYAIHLYSNPTADLSGNGEAHTYIGSPSNITTNGSGDASFSFDVTGSIDNVSATATDVAGGFTSEFALNMPLAPRLEVYYGDVQVADGTTTPIFADSTRPLFAVRNTITFSNTGNATLTLGTLSLPTAFTVVTALPASLAPGASADLVIQYYSSTARTHNGQLSLVNNDPRTNLNPFNFNIRGVASNSGVGNVFVDPVNGDDFNFGGNPTYPKQTIAGALQVISDGGNLYLTSADYEEDFSTSTLSVNVDFYGASAAPSSIENFTLNNSGKTFTLLTDLEVLEGFNLVAGTVNLNGNHLTIHDFNYTAGSFNGSATSSLTITGEGDEIVPPFTAGFRLLENLTINAPSPPNMAFEMQTPLTISGTLTMTNGDIVLGDHDLTVTGLISGGSALSYIRTNGAGRLNATVLSGLAYNFPLGINPYAPLLFEFATPGSAVISIGVLEAPTGSNNSPATEHAINNYWQLSSSVALTGVEATTQWTGDRELPNFDRSNSMVAYRQGTSGVWQLTSPAGSAAGADPYTRTAGTMAGFGSWSGSTTYQISVTDDNAASPLPVQWATFVANYKPNEGTLLQWTTSSELNNLGFDIERSWDGKTWEAVHFTSGHGTTLQPQNYKWLDKGAVHVQASTIYYRMKQMDFNGAFEYSQTRVVNKNAVVAANSEVASRIDLQVAPNPVQNQTLVLHAKSNTEDVVMVNVMNTSGQMLVNQRWNLAIGSQSLTIPVGHLPSGVYLLHVTSGNLAPTTLRVVIP